MLDAGFWMLDDDDGANYTIVGNDYCGITCPGVTRCRKSRQKEETGKRAQVRVQQQTEEL